MTMARHDKVQKKFIIETNGREAFLAYRVLDDHTLEFFSTFVPPEGRGQGVAKHLVEAGVSYARGKGLKIEPTCSYVAQHFEKNLDNSELQTLRA
jgi:predicted GNAT family acetyltransferase